MSYARLPLSIERGLTLGYGDSRRRMSFSMLERPRKEGARLFNRLDLNASVFVATAGHLVHTLFGVITNGTGLLALD